MIAELLDRRRRLTVFLCALAATILLAALVVHLVFIPDLAQRVGVDFRQYTEATRDWLSGGRFYHDWQLAGPYDMPRDEYELARLPVLYPPTALLLLAPFAHLPVLWPLWWLLPLGAVVAAVIWWRPAPWTWPVLTLCALGGDTMWLIISGNPVMWTAGLMAAATFIRWPAVGILLKPSIGFFALFGIRSRSWWLALLAFVLVSIPFGTMWADYASTLLNSRGGGLLYSMNNLPLMLIPLAAWAGRRRRPPIAADA